MGLNYLIFILPVFVGIWFFYRVLYIVMCVTFWQLITKLIYNQLKKLYYIDKNLIKRGENYE